MRINRSTYIKFAGQNVKKMTYILLFLGLGLLLLGANFLVDASVAIAKKTKISDFVIGMTIVGIGTSTPELLVSVSSALQGLGDVAIGNIVGSNICNVMLILGITALISPFAITMSNLRRDIPMTAIVSILLFVLSFDTIIHGADTNCISRPEGLFMLLCFAVFMYYSLKQSAPDANDTATEQKPSFLNRFSYIVLSAVALASLALLIWGGNMFLDSAVSLAKVWGMSDSVISITILAVGTSLPELITCIFAAMKGNSQLALGNVLGSNIFNIVFILGAAATITPLTLNSIGLTDFAVMIVSAILLVIFSFTMRRNVIDRTEGALFLAGYVAYTVYLLIR